MGQVKNLRTRQKEERRKRILDAARALFFERGYVSATIKDIADNAAVSPPTVHKYYGTKQLLLFDLVLDCESEIASEIETKIAIEKNPVKSATFLLTQIIEGALTRIDRKTWMHAYSVFGNQPIDGQNRSFESILAEQYDGLEKVFADLQVDGGLSPMFDGRTARELLQTVNSSLFKKLLIKEIDLKDYRKKIKNSVRFVLEPHVLNGSHT